MGASGPITVTSESGEVLVDFNDLVSNDNQPMDLLQVASGEKILTLEMTYYQDVARAPDENPPLYVRGFVDKEFEKPVYDAFIPRSGPLQLPGFEQYAFTFTRNTATVLEVAKDPGLGLVGTFFTIMAFGFTVSLYTTYTRCWAKILPSPTVPGTSDIIIGGLADKNKVSFERDFEKLATRAYEALAAKAANLSPQQDQG
jgi:cytochrome c biogenesis protein ResB